MAAPTTERVAAASPAPDPRQALAEEWAIYNPQTPEEIAHFYQQSRRLAGDLEAWHELPERQAITDMIVHVAKESGAQDIVDIGCGAGHDLLALRPVLPAARLEGVEPNRGLRESIPPYTRIIRCETVSDARIETADLLICIDVLEHVVDPEAYLAGIGQRAPLGCLLFETTATHDCGTPLHLRANWGWHPGRVLERHGWECVDHSGRVRVWRRVAQTGRERASLLLCAYRSVNAETLTPLMGLCAGNELGWRLRVKTGDALISRSRSVILTAWHRETNDDVALMVDDDITFTTAEADRIVELCRNGHDIIAGAYPVRNGGHLACRGLPGTKEFSFGLQQPPIEILYAATGFVAINRRVIDVLIKDLPLCHATEPWSFYPLFPAYAAPNEAAGGWEWLSEDYGFCDLARKAGFKVWLDPSVVLKHASSVQISVRNMGAIYEAISGV